MTTTIIQLFLNIMLLYAAQPQLELLQRDYLVDGYVEEVYVLVDKQNKKETVLSSLTFAELPKEQIDFFINKIKKQIKDEIATDKESLFVGKNDQALENIIIASIKPGKYITPRNLFFRNAVTRYFKEVNKSFELGRKSYCEMQGCITPLQSLPEIKDKYSGLLNLQTNYSLCSANSDILNDQEIKRYIQSFERKSAFILFNLFTIPELYAAPTPPKPKYIHETINRNEAGAAQNSNLVFDKGIKGTLTDCNGVVCENTRKLSEMIQTNAHKKAEILAHIKQQKDDVAHLKKVAREIREEQLFTSFTDNQVRLNELESAVKEDRMYDPRIVKPYAPEELKRFEESAQRIAAREEARKTQVASNTKTAPIAKSSTANNSIAGAIKNDNKKTTEEIEAMEKMLADSPSSEKNDVKDDEVAKVDVPKEKVEGQETSKNMARASSASATTTAPIGSSGETIRTPTSTPGKAADLELKNAKIDPALKELFEKAEGAEYLGELDKFINIEGGVLYLNAKFFEKHPRFNHEGHWLKLILVLNNNKVRRISIIGNGKSSVLPIIGVKGSSLLLPKGTNLPSELVGFKSFIEMM